MQLHDARGKRLYLTAEERRAFIAAAARAARPVRTLCAADYFPIPRGQAARVQSSASPPDRREERCSPKTKMAPSDRLEARHDRMLPKGKGASSALQPLLRRRAP
jgi:hypothetical protein